MDFWRRASNPWGQDVLIGVAWDLLWAAVLAGIVFVVGHAIYAKWLAPRGAAQQGETEPAVAAANLPKRVLRHTLSSRTFHWLMSVTMFVLLITAFFPLVGIQFAWVTIHWIAGIGLLATVLYHIVHASFWHDFRSMWIEKKDVEAASADVKEFFTRTRVQRPKAGKYPFDHKLYHHIVALVTVAAIATGLLMMVRVDTPFWERNPYLLSDSTWGIVYVLHGLSGVALITLVMAHIYFAIRPDKWWITMSMINGWIGREEYLSHHDPERWVVSGSDGRLSGRKTQALSDSSSREQKHAS